MITKAELTETINELTDKFNYISNELESLWQFCAHKNWSGNPEYKEIADRIEHIQFSSYANPSDFAKKYGFNKLFKVIEENEKVHELDRLIECERMVDKAIEFGKYAERLKSEKDSKQN